MEEIIRAYIAREILKRPKMNIALDQPLISSGLIDSFKLVDLAIFIEDNFDIQIDDAELTADKIDTIAKIIKLVERHASLSKVG
jgi:acyl carrier protein